MRKAYSQTESILKTHYDKLELVAETLIKNEKFQVTSLLSLWKTALLPMKSKRKRGSSGRRYRNC